MKLTGKEWLGTLETARASALAWEEEQRSAGGPLDGPLHLERKRIYILDRVHAEIQTLQMMRAFNPPREPLCEMPSWLRGSLAKLIGEDAPG